MSGTADCVLYAGLGETRLLAPVLEFAWLLSTPKSRPSRYLPDNVLAAVFFTPGIRCA